MDQETPTQVQLAQQDAERVNRLTEEIQGRLEELALIITRVSGRPLHPDAVRKFVPIRRSMQADDDGGAPIVSIEIVDPPDGGPSHCIIHCPGGGDWIEIPCGSGPLPCG